MITQKTILRKVSQSVLMLNNQLLILLTQVIVQLL